MNYYLKTTTAIARIRAYEGATVGWKKDDKGNFVVNDGKPVWVKADGSEIAFDPAQVETTIRNLNREAQTHRETAEAATAKLKAFDGLDVTAARKALETVAGLEGKKLIETGEVDRLKEQISTQYQTKLDAATAETAGLQKRLNDTLLSHAFATSKYVAEKIAVPGDMLRATFGDRFSIKNDKIVALDASGNAILSETRMGEPADFDEALGIIVKAYPYKDSILKGVNNKGSGNNGGGGNSGSRKTVSRADFDKMTPIEQAAHAKAVTAGTATIAD